VSKKRKPADGLLPRAEAWRQSSSEYKARVHRLVIDDKPHKGVDGQPVRMVPAMRAKILDKITAAAAAHEDRARKAGSSPRKNNPTRRLISSALKGSAGPAEQYERYKALAGDDHVNYRRFKEVRLEILQSK
jgi:hypothetical protein